MPGARQLNVCDKLLLAAFRCEEEGKTPFSAEDLVISAWRCYPNTFGLSGYHDGTGRPAYPDSNRVFAEIMGSKPIRKRGLLVKVGRKMYQLTETGRSLARGLPTAAGEADSGDLGAKVRLGRKLVAELRRLIGSRAVQKTDNGQTESLTFHDACVFWGITPRSSAIELEGRHANLTGTIAAARHVLETGASRLEHGGQPVSDETLALLERTHAALLERFSAEIDMIMKRRDQRRI